MPPLVSICMPHLNSRPFTQERLETILQQTVADWELIIVDSHSDDGSYEWLETRARDDRRIRLVQAPRDGIYANLNRALQLATGTYVYIATSDDTMTPDCLERLVEALEQNPDCGVAHCCLNIIDEQGQPVGSADAWKNYLAQEYFGEWIHRDHIRQAPHDGLLHFGLLTIYTSLTQLLVRRSALERIGFFRTDCGSYADFEWGMRVGLTENVVHVPRALATWRRHGQQATQTDRLLRARAQGQFHWFARKALEAVGEREPKLAATLKKSPLNDFYLVDEFNLRMRLSHCGSERRLQLLAFALKHPRFALRWAFSKIVRRESITPAFLDAFRRELSRLGLGQLLRPAAVAAVAK